MTILFLGLVWPEPVSSAAGWRLLQLIRLFSKSHEVHFASAAMKSEYSYELSTLEVEEHPILLNDSSFDTFIKKLSPDIVVFDRFMIEEQYGWRVAENCPNALRILDTEDLHFLRAARQEAYKKQVPVDLYNETTKREIAAIVRCDLSLMISEEEIKLLMDKFNIASEQLIYLPFQEKRITAEDINQLKSFEERKNFVFIGNFIHEPNWRTVEVLKRNVWPILRKLVPNSELHIYGAYPSEKVFQLHKPQEGFVIKGRAEDARETAGQYRVLLAPIPFGAGAKGKFVDAMRAGTPTMSSVVGAESMSVDNQWNGFIEDDKDEFVKKAILLYQDKEQWSAAQLTGFQIFNSRYADTSFSDKLMDWIVKAKENIGESRKRNIIGQILMQNQFNTTKYMSLWIEEKNKRKS